MRGCAQVGRKSGFEFKLKKGQFNQAEIEFWGCIVDALGRRPQLKKVEQLLNWPEPVDQAAVNSFLCFVNYLREYLPPNWVAHEQVLKPFRKKGCDFKGLWNGDPKYREAFMEIRKAMTESVVIQSAASVSLCLAGRIGRSAARG